MTAAPRAADLPKFSTVACTNQAWTKTRPSDQHPWRDLDGDYAGNNFIDVLLADGRATVLRVGDGSEEG